MTDIALIAAVAAFVGLVVVVELAAAVLPLVIILTCVPPSERRVLVELVTATGGGGRLRVGRVLRLIGALDRNAPYAHTRDARAGRRESGG
ncbi:hypothetical protein [Asanoa iriomotensis]|uniref:Secreted protein n=1 Tax=Asanoa iriomotensis TaxID=234613 RepID=A0ABQ4C110_9ACTN|nr:hypothetical protein [Asanoa iriomotensis]GIF56473.1 hypothetical protein Air01nite_25680 [Asanoa iriomotensis]